MEHIEFLEEESNFIAEFLTDERKVGIEKVLDDRTNFLTVVLENLYQPHNASAVLRTCDCFGVERAHIIDDQYEFIVKERMTQGAHSWVEAVKHKNTKECLTQLKSEGYLIATTDLDHYDYTLEDMPLDQKTAIVFGTEWTGTSDVSKEIADIRIKIPMYGFTQSFNISVSAAIILHHLGSKMRQSGVQWKLSNEDRIIARHYWYTQISEMRLKHKQGDRT